jgi:phosphate starvation-inducible PhoH-like protein
MKEFNTLAKKGESPQFPVPKTPNQKELINAIKNYPMVITQGPAGVGKSFIVAKMAAHAMKNRQVGKIIITRPTVPTGRSVGFFPGTLADKVAPWVVPIMEVLTDTLGKGDVECLLKNDRIEVVPFETIRGRSFRDCFVILDEAQNCTYEEIKAFLTRVGEDSKVVINGDITQSDLRHTSGLEVALSMISQIPELQKSVPVVTFTSDDVVRSGLCKLWVQAFEAVESQAPEETPEKEIKGFTP